MKETRKKREKKNNNNNTKTKKIIMKQQQQQKTNQVKFVWTDFSACLDFPLYPSLVLSEAVCMLVSEHPGDMFLLANV